MYGAPLFSTSSEQEASQPVQTSTNFPAQDGNGDCDLQPQSEAQTEESVPKESAQTMSQEMFPIVVYSHGLGAMRTTYSAICCDIVSHGFIVACVEHQDQSACLSTKYVPVEGTNPVRYQEEFINFLRRETTAKEFPLRNRQV